MKVDTMRFVDRYAGIPLCACGTIIKKIFFSSSGRTKPKNILFIELSEMGSAILADPAMRKAAREHGSELFFLIFKKNKPSLALLNTVKEENIFTISSDGFLSLVRDTCRFLIWARKKKIDTAIDLELFSRYTALLSGFCGADNVVGFHNFHGEGLYRGSMLTHRVLYNPHIHIAKNFIAMINALSEDSDGRPYSKTRIEDDEIRLEKAEISKTAAEKVKEKIRKLYPGYSGGRIVLINPNASELLPQRRWEMSRYASLIRLISERFGDVLILITGAASEKMEAENLVKEADSPRCVNFAGQLHLSELTALYSLSALMVSNDSGPAHFASVTHMPTVVIFGPETPDLYRSLGDTSPVYAGLACSPCVSAANHRKTPCRDNVCLRAVTVDAVFSEVIKRLDNA